MGVMYTCMVFGLAEISSSLPTAGAGYAFARRALGPLGGFATGMAVLIEYAVAPAAIATFIGGYIEALGLFGLTNSWPVYLVTYVVFIGIHLRGVGEALKIMFAITAIAVVALVSPSSDSCRSSTRPNCSTSSRMVRRFQRVPALGIPGVLAALVFGIWFFLAVEGVPLAAEETDDPKRDMPRGIIVAVILLVIFGALMLILVPGPPAPPPWAPSTRCRRPCGWLTVGLADRRHRQLRGPRRPGGEFLLHRLRLLPPAFRALPGGLPALVPLADGSRTPPGWPSWCPAPGLHARRGHRNGGLLINIAVFGATVSYVLLNLSATSCCGSRSRTRARLPHPGRRRHHRHRAGAGRVARGRHVRGGRYAASHHRRRVRSSPSRTTGSTAATASWPAPPRRSSPGWPGPEADLKQQLPRAHPAPPPHEAHHEAEAPMTENPNPAATACSASSSCGPWSDSARSTRSSWPSPTCRAGCRASAATPGTSSTRCSRTARKAATTCWPSTSR